jgi:hypothetical protein
VNPGPPAIDPPGSEEWREEDQIAEGSKQRTLRDEPRDHHDGVDVDDCWLLNRAGG